jgi:hypothetical protein
MRRAWWWTGVAPLLALLGGCGFDDGIGNEEYASPHPVLEARTLDVAGFARDVFASGAPFRVRAEVRNRGDVAMTLLRQGAAFGVAILLGDSLVASAREGCVDTCRVELIHLAPGEALDFDWLAPGGECAGSGRVLPPGDYTVRVWPLLGLQHLDPPAPRELAVHIVP